MSGVGDGWQRVVVPAGRACHDSGDTQPKIVNKELRQAWDGAWYPLVADDGPSFTNYYGSSADEIWEASAHSTRKAFLLTVSPGTTDRTWQLSNLVASASVAQKLSAPAPKLQMDRDGSYVAASPVYGSVSFLVGVRCCLSHTPEMASTEERVIKMSVVDVVASGASDVNEARPSPKVSDDLAAESIQVLTDAGVQNCGRFAPSTPKAAHSHQAAPKDTPPKPPLEFKNPTPEPKSSTCAMIWLDSRHVGTSPTLPKTTPTALPSISTSTSKATLLQPAVPKHPAPNEETTLPISKRRPPVALTPKGPPARLSTPDGLFHTGSEPTQAKTPPTTPPLVLGPNTDVIDLTHADNDKSSIDMQPDL